MPGAGVQFDDNVPYDATIAFDGGTLRTMYDVLRARCLSALGDGSVAVAAGLPIATWQLATAPHVFHGIAGSIGGRNRGRLPFVEFALEDVSFSLVSRDGGQASTRIRIRVHVAARTADLASTFTGDLTLACLAALRSELADTYMAAGTVDDIQPVTFGPFGHMRESTLVVEHSYDRKSYQQNG